MYEFRLRFIWSLLLTRFELTIFQHWFRFFLDQWWSLGLSELTIWQSIHRGVNKMTGISQTIFWKVFCVNENIYIYYCNFIEIGSLGPCWQKKTNIFHHLNHIWTTSVTHSCVTLWICQSVCPAHTHAPPHSLFSDALERHQLIGRIIHAIGTVLVTAIEPGWF